jgi:starvation-inducible DNA-binding protein
MAKKESALPKTKLTDQLNKHVADANVLYIKIHNFHWNVKGPSFFSLHVKFQELYEEVALIMDELAERIIGIGGKPVASMREYLDQSSIKEAKGGEDPSEMVQALADDFSAIVDEMEETASKAEEEGDDPTADMLIGFQERLQKHIWMLRAYAGK